MKKYKTGACSIYLEVNRVKNNISVTNWYWIKTFNLKKIKRTINIKTSFIFFKEMSLIIKLSLWTNLKRKKNTKLVREVKAQFSSIIKISSNQSMMTCCVKIKVKFNLKLGPRRLLNWIKIRSIATFSKRLQAWIQEITELILKTYIIPYRPDSLQDNHQTSLKDKIHNPNYILNQFKFQITSIIHLLRDDLLN